jgi:hypothetical protein
MGRYPYRGMVLRIEGPEREALLDLNLSPLSLRLRPAMKAALTFDAILSDPDLNTEANRIADLVFNRVDASGSTQQHTAPYRNAPSNLVVQVAEKLREQPLVCALCGGLLSLRPKNRMLQPSADRIDSAVGSYGPENFQLAHLACNLAKNNATVEQFEEWLRLVRGVTNSEEDSSRNNT